MREMTGTEVINRRASDFMTSSYPSPKHLLKSRSSLELTNHSRAERNQEKQSHLGHLGHKSGDLNNSSRRSSSHRQRAAETNHKSRARTKELVVPCDSLDVNRNGSTTPILPPIAGHHISHANVKNGGISPRHADGPAPTRLAVRTSASPENTDNNRPQHNVHKPQLAIEESSPPPQIIASTSRHGSLPNNVIGSCHVTAPDSPRVLETSRLSPIHVHDRPKTKFEKKVMKHVVDEQSPSSPRTYKIPSADLKKQNPPPTPSRDGQAKQRRPNFRSFPKVATTDEPFSVRRKIEQFRKWHEEHYADTLKTSAREERSNQPISANTNDGDKGLTTNGEERVDFSKILEDNIVGNRVATSVGERKDDSNCSQHQDINGNNITGKLKTFSKKDVRKPGAKTRPQSGASWKTWRGINQSDAYDDVKKYIKENELMDEEKELWIQNWICDVRTAMEDSEEMYIDE